MKRDRKTGAAQFTNADLDAAGKTIAKGLFVVTADDLNLFLRVYEMQPRKRKSKRGES